MPDPFNLNLEPNKPENTLPVSPPAVPEVTTPEIKIEPVSPRIQSTMPTIPSKPPTPSVTNTEAATSWIEKNIPSLAKLIAKMKNLKKAKKTETKVEIDGTVKLPSKNKPAWQRKFENYWLLFIRKKRLLAFLDQLSTLVSSDIRLIDGIRLLKQQNTNWAMKRLLVKIIEDIEAGKRLSDSLSLYYPFPKMWVNLIKAGESSGQLAEILKELNEQQLAQSRLMGNIKGAMVYPVFVIGMLIVLMTIMMTTIVPEIESIYKQARVDLPSITQLIISFSRFIVQNGITLAIVMVISVILLVLGVRKVYYLKKAWDYLNLRWPIFGALNKTRNLIIFSDNLQLLLRSGVLLTEALTITAEIAPSINYQEEIIRLKEKISQGDNMSKTMGLIDTTHEKFEKNFYFPLEFAQMVNVGEQTGNINQVLSKIKENYTDKVDHTVKNLSTLLEPIMIIVVGGMVLIFLLGIMLPFFNLGQVARGL